MSKTINHTDTGTIVCPWCYQELWDDQIVYFYASDSVVRRACSGCGKKYDVFKRADPAKYTTTKAK